jgi:hypothetical protein
MGRPNYNPPNNDCPQCTEPSRTYYIGAKRVTLDGVAYKQTRYECEHKHPWTVRVEVVSPSS